MEHTKSASRGQTPTDQKLVAVVEEAWLHGIGTKSDGARYMADHLAVAASRGLITVELDPGVFGAQVAADALGARLPLAAQGPGPMTHAYVIYLPDLAAFVGSPGYSRSRPTSYLHQAQVFPTEGEAEAFFARWKVTQVAERYGSNHMILPITAVIEE